MSLERNGFVLVEHKTAVKDFFDRQQLETIYYAEVEALIKKMSGAKRVVLFDHTLRSGNEAEREERLIREPVLSAHNDYTEWSGPQRVRDLLPDEAETLLKGRFAIIQVWRAINKPIQSNPLAVADAASVAFEDLHDRGAALSESRGADLSPASYNPRAPLVLLSGDAARRGAGVHGLRFGRRTAGRASRRTHRSTCRTTPPNAAAAAEHRSARAGVFLAGYAREPPFQRSRLRNSRRVFGP